MKDFIELRHILTVLRSRLWLLVSITAVAALTGLLVSRGQAPVYQATTTMLVGQFMQFASVNRADIQTSGDVAKTYADIGLRQPILSEVVATLKLDETWQALKKQVRVKAIEGTQLIEVTAEANSPRMARDIADEVASRLIALSPATMSNGESGIDYSFIRKQLDSLKQRLTDSQNRMKEIEAAIAASPPKTELAELQDERIKLEQSITEWEKNYVSLSNLASQERASNNYLTVIEPAQLPKDPVRPRKVLDTIIAGGVGLLLALGAIFISDYLDYSVHSPEDMEQVLGLTPLAVIGAMRRPGLPRSLDLWKGGWRELPLVRGPSKGIPIAGHTLVTLEQPDSAISESFRTLRTNIQFAGVAKPLRSLVVTSAVPVEGKTFVAANLAVVMAQTGKRVVLVDADLRRPSLHTVLGLPNNPGLTNLILSGSSPGIIQRVPAVPNLMVITSGPMPANPSELLDSDRVMLIMSYLAERADIVIYDSPPTGMVTDPAILSARADAVILVTRARSTRRDLILGAKQALQNVGVNLILPVLNAVAPRDMGTYQGYYRQQTPPPESEGRPGNKREGQADSTVLYTSPHVEQAFASGRAGADEREEAPWGRPNET